MKETHVEAGANTAPDTAGLKSVGNHLKALSGSPAHLAIFLGGLALVVGAVLALSNGATQDAIALRANEDLQNSLSQVIPQKFYDKGPAADTLNVDDKELGHVLIYRADKNGEVSAVAFRVVAKGYAGDIVILMGLASDGTVLGVRILSHAETPGLGDKIEERKSDWVFAFNGHSLGDPDPERWKIKKDGGIFDQFTGASITPRSVVRAIKQGLEFFSRHRAELVAIGKKESS